MTRVIVAALTAFLLADGREPQQLSRSGYGAYEVSLAVSGNQRAAAWYDTRDGHPEIYLRILNAEGQVSGPERRVTSGTDFAYEPDIAAVRGNFAIAWYEKNPSTGRLHAKLGLVTGEGRMLWSKPLSTPDHDTRNPVVRIAGGEVFCAWLEGLPDQEPSVWAGWFDLSGQVRRAAQRLAAAGSTTWNLNAAVDDRGDVWVAFDAAAGTRADGLFLVRIGKTASDVRRISADDGSPSKYPDLAFSGSEPALTWFDERDGNQEVYLFIAPIDRLLQGVEADSEPRARRVTNTRGESIGAYVAWNHGKVGLAWSDNTDGQHEIYFERFDSGGESLGTAKRLTNNSTESLIPAIRPWRDGFAVAWNEYRPGPSGAHGPGGHSEIALSILPGLRK